MSADSPEYLILAIESATPRGSVALVSEDGAPCEVPLPEGGRMSEAVLPVVDALLRGRGGRSVTHVAVSAGPGSFTGLRVGMAVAKGFCFGWGIPILPVPTLHALAWRFRGEISTVCPIQDARKGELYSATFSAAAGFLSRLSPDRALTPEALVASLPPGPVLFCGDAVPPFSAFLRERLGERAGFPPSGEEYPRASAVGELALAFLREGVVLPDPVSVVPAYVRGFDNSPSSDRLRNHQQIPEVTMEQATMDAKLAQLMASNPEVRGLVEEHRLLDDKLKEFDRKVYLLPDEEVERKRLQKLKLAKKDKIVSFLSGT